MLDWESKNKTGLPTLELQAYNSVFLIYVPFYKNANFVLRNFFPHIFPAADGYDKELSHVVDAFWLICTLISTENKILLSCSLYLFFL